jgi:hypothetical protein
MVKDNEQDMHKASFIKWLFTKSFVTLSALMSYMNQQALLPLVYAKFKTCSLENSVKLLVRSK